MDWGSEFSTTSDDVTIEKVIKTNFNLTLMESDQQGHLRVSTKANTLTSKPQHPSLPFVSAKELHRCRPFISRIFLISHQP